MGASNRLQDLDPALLRPGRFDRQVNVAPPDLTGREEIFAVHTRSKPLGADVDLMVLARRTAGLTGADLANIANEAAIFAARNDQQYIRQEDFENAMERVLTGLQKRRVVTEKEKRILAYHESGHALVAYLMGDVMPVQKVTIVGRGDALGLAYYLPVEDRYLHTKEELLDVMKVALAGRAAEEIVFGRVTNGAASDLEKVTQIARAMVFEFGMSEVAPSRTMRADNYALSEETKRLRDSEQARLTDHAYEEALRLLGKHRVTLDRLANALLERETLERDEFLEMMGDLPRESRSAETVGMVRALERELLAALELPSRACERGKPRVPGGADLVDPLCRRAERRGRQRVARFPPARCASTRPASRSAARCFETAWRVTGRSAASSVGVAVPARRASRRRTGGSGRRAPETSTARCFYRSRRHTGARRGVQLERGRPRGRLLAHEDPRPALGRLEAEVDDAVVVEPQDDARAFLDGFDHSLAHLAVVPAEHASAARGRVELDLVREPLLQLRLVRQRRPDLVGRRVELDLTHDLHEQPPGCVLLSNRTVAH